MQTKITSYVDKSKQNWAAACPSWAVRRTLGEITAYIGLFP